MGLPKGRIDGIQSQFSGDLTGQVGMFLERYKFPSFEADKDTAKFLIETLERVNLPDVAKEVKRDLD